MNNIINDDNHVIEMILIIHRHSSVDHTNHIVFELSIEVRRLRLSHHFQFCQQINHYFEQFDFHIRIELISILLEIVDKAVHDYMMINMKQFHLQ